MARITFVTVLLAVACTVPALAQLFKLQVVEATSIEQEALEQQMQVTSLASSRGTIYDRNMNILAQSTNAYAVILSPASIDEGEEGDDTRNLIAGTLSDILDIDVETILTKLNKTGSYYQVLKRRVEEAEAEKIREFVSEYKLNSVYLIDDTRRYYPYGSFMSQVIGFTGSDDQGLTGLEATYDSYLSGTYGRTISAKSPWDTDIPYDYQETYEAEDGCSLVLTIDTTVQYYLEKYLDIAIEEYHVQNGAIGIIMECDTGAILGMATRGNTTYDLEYTVTEEDVADAREGDELYGLEAGEIYTLSMSVGTEFDPNSPNEIADSETLAFLEGIQNTNLQNLAWTAALNVQWRNRAVSDIYEPGSVFKTITAAAALEEGVVTLDTAFYCAGYKEILDRKIYCDTTTGHGQETFLQGYGNSCNPVFMEVGAMLGADRYYKYFEAFGFTETTGIDLPGEAVPVQDSTYHSISVLNNDVSLAVSSFGQTFKVTPIQMITAISAVVNGGNLVQPHVVDSILDADGNVVETIGTEVKLQVISEEVSETMQEMMEFVVTDGGGKNAAVTGYRIGGKSGTSEKLDQVDENGNSTDERLASFVAVAPADDPKYVVLVILDEPHPDSDLRYGSTLAAPVCREILSEMLPYLGLEPTYDETETELIDINTPYLVDYGTLDADSALRKQGLESVIKGSGSSVVRQSPEAGMPIPSGGTVILYTESDEAEMATVPDVTGMTPSNASAMLKNAGFNIKISGTGASDRSSTASGQSVEAYTEAELGTVVEVTFVSATVAD